MKKYYIVSLILLALTFIVLCTLAALLGGYTIIPVWASVILFLVVANAIIALGLFVRDVINDKL